MAFADISPILASVGITNANVTNYFSNLPEPTEPTPLPEITKAKCVAVADKYFEDGKMNFDKHNGYLSVAQEVGLTVGQVKSIVAEIQNLYGIWSAPEPVEPEPEV